MRPTTTEAPWLVPTDGFSDRHIGPGAADVEAMLQLLGYATLDELSEAVVPGTIRLRRSLALEAPRGEHALHEEARRLAGRNRVFESFIGLGYHDCITPPVILRNVLENPAWYTQYTPYQAEISQGRLEALLTFQTMVADLTALPLANASLLDEATAAAEAMSMCLALRRDAERNSFVADPQCHPQTLAVLHTRAEPLGLRLIVAEPESLDLAAVKACGLLVQSPDTRGRVRELAGPIARAHAAGTWVVVATDLLAATLLTPPGEMGADIAVGSTQRFGVPLGYGGPHAAFLASREEFKRQIPGRIVGVSRDERGRPAYRMALQTREQHIRRDKATSNICTAQVLLAVMAAMYAVYHGPAGLRRIARRIAGLTATLDAGLRALGRTPAPGPRFDTLSVEVDDAAAVIARAQVRQINLRQFEDGRTLGVSLNETTTLAGVQRLLEVLGGTSAGSIDVQALAREVQPEWPDALTRASEFLTHEVFHRYHAEHEMLRYLHRLQERDISLVHSMIPLGSCTMKLNGTSLMEPITWPEFARLHPFAPADQAVGYQEIFKQLEAWLAEITGLPAVSLQPNSGAQGEYAGLLVIRAWHASRGERQRDVCLIPTSAHGTNPASAVMAGLRVVPVACDERGNIDIAALTAQADEHRDRLAALMVTYPSTHGVFEEGIQELCAVIHERGGQVYMDGANMNAQVGLCRPAEIGADVVHLNLHKTFCIPHGGGGPGMGPIAVAEHLAPFLPGHPLTGVGGGSAIGPVAAAPWGSAGILPISWAYIAMMGPEGLKRATQVAILNANYMAQRLAEHFPVLYAGPNGRVAHEFILDLRPLRDRTGVTADDIAKRLMDFGLHAPTMSWPVAGTLMVEPTESESREELDRFCEAMIAIRAEIRQIELGHWDRENNPLKHAPHTAEVLLASTWDRPYGREQAAYPLPWVRTRKFWPPVSRIDNAWGDRNLICTCDGMEAYRSTSG